VGTHNFSGPHIFISHSTTEGINTILRLDVMNTAAFVSCSISKEKYRRNLHDVVTAAFVRMLLKEVIFPEHE
jgi:hypothetical protein